MYAQNGVQQKSHTDANSADKRSVSRDIHVEGKKREPEFAEMAPRRNARFRPFVQFDKMPSLTNSQLVTINPAQIEPDSSDEHMIGQRLLPSSLSDIDLGMSLVTQRSAADIDDTEPDGVDFGICNSEHDPDATMPGSRNALASAKTVQLHAQPPSRLMPAWTNRGDTVRASRNAPAPQILKSALFGNQRLLRPRPCSNHKLRRFPMYTPVPTEIPAPVWSNVDVIPVPPPVCAAPMPRPASVIRVSMSLASPANPSPYAGVVLGAMMIAFASIAVLGGFLASM